MHPTSIKYVPKPGDLIHVNLVDQVTIGLVVKVRKCKWLNHSTQHGKSKKNLYDYSLWVLFNSKIRKFPNTFAELVQSF